MNNLPFTPVPLQYYDNTFLQRIIVEFSFNPFRKGNEPLAFKDKLCHFLNIHFGVSCDDSLEDVFWKDGIQLAKGDKSVIWHLKTNGVSVMMGTDNYKSFVDSVLPTVYKMRRFIRTVFELDQVSSLRVRKINVWQFHDDKPNGLNVEDLKKAIFSSDLLNQQSCSELTESEREIRGMKKITFVDESSDSLVIKYFSKNFKEDVVALFLDSERLHADSVKEEDIENCLVNMNKELYNAFHWSVTAKVLNIMKGGK